VARLAEAGVPKTLGAGMALLPDLGRGPDIVQLADETGRKIEDVTRAFFQLGETLGIDWLLGQSDLVETEGFYDRLALNRTVDQIEGAQRRIALAALNGGHSGKAVEAWLGEHETAVERARRSVNELVGSGQISLAKLTVAGAHLADLAGR
jgi:glutamate dehydrogenase